MHNKLPEQYYFIDKFDKKNIDKLKQNTGIIYRNYSKKINNKQILELKNFCNKKKLKFFISNNIRLAHQLKLDGAYIPSFNNNLRHLNYKLKNNFIIIGSAHNIKEIRIKELQKANLIFLSSIFKKNKNYLGVNKFQNISKLTKLKIIALGGVSKKNINKLKILNCFGFAGISYFK
jgi:thiamine-phosphate pyrophosphorylase